MKQKEVQETVRAHISVTQSVTDECVEMKITIAEPMVNEKVVEASYAQTEKQQQFQSASNTITEKEEGEWTTPIRVGRSPNKTKKGLEFGQVSILSNSRFSVLSEENIEGEKEMIELEEADQSKTETLTVTTTVLNAEEKTEVETEDKQETEHYKADIGEKGNNKNQDRMGSSSREIPIRQPLPRTSKDKHKFLADTPTTQKATDANPRLSNTRPFRRNGFLLEH